MTKTYKDFYGSTAKLTIEKDKTATLRIRTSNGKVVRHSQHSNEKAARAAMNRDGDGWQEIIAQHEAQPERIV